MWITLRHGETQYHVEDRYQGSLDDSILTATGRAQADELRECLSHLAVTHCFVSPVRRAVQTLEQLEPVLKHAQIIVTDELAEVSIGHWEGRLKAELRKTEPDALQLWRMMPHLYCDPTGGKPLMDMYGRIRSFVQRNNHTAGASLVIGHDHVNRAILASLLDLPVASHYAIPQAVSSVSIATRQGSAGRFALHVSNLEHESGRAKPLAPIDVPRLIFVRHGVTDGNTAKMYQGSADMALNDLGRTQAMMLSEILSPVQPAAVYTSSLRRARDTASILPFFASIPVNVEPRLNEYHYGRWQGRTASEVEKAYPEDVAAWRVMNSDRPIPDGERISELVARVSAVLTTLWKQARDNGAIVIVSHDVVIRAAIALSLRLNLRQIWAFPIANGGVSELRMNEQGWPVLVRHNILPGRIEDRYGIECL